MPNCDFFAAGQDHRAVLDFVISSGDCDIYEFHSRYDKSARQFHSLSDFEQHFSVSDWGVGANEGIMLQLFPHGAKGRVVSERIELKGARCGGAKFRFSTVGWGLVQLYLEKVAEGYGYLPHSHTNHNSAKGANSWASTHPGLGQPDDWDWSRVAQFSNRLNRFIRSLGVAKQGARVILPGAAELQKQGIELG